LTRTLVRAKAARQVVIDRQPAGRFGTAEKVATL